MHAAYILRGRPASFDVVAPFSHTHSWRGRGGSAMGNITVDEVFGICLCFQSAHICCNKVQFRGEPFDDARVHVGLAFRIIVEEQVFVYDFTMKHI